MRNPGPAAPKKHALCPLGSTLLSLLVCFSGHLLFTASSSLKSDAECPPSARSASLRSALRCSFRAPSRTAAPLRNPRLRGEPETRSVDSLTALDTPSSSRSPSCRRSVSDQSVLRQRALRSPPSLPQLVSDRRPLISKFEAPPRARVLTVRRRPRPLFLRTFPPVPSLPTLRSLLAGSPLSLFLRR